MKISFATRVPVVALLSTLALGPVCAAAADKPVLAPAGDTRSDIHIRYTDLDLSKAADVHKLYRRVVRAAKLVCGSPSAYYGSTARMEECLQKTIADTIRQLDKPTLSSYYAKNNLP